MLAALGFGMVLVFMYLIMARRLLPVVALVVVPIAFGLAAGVDPAGLGRMMLEGLRTLAPTGVMLMFAILYFGVMIDAGLFDPVVRRVLAAVRGDPLRVVVGTAMLALFVSLDGDGSTTYMITVAAMLPLYRRLGMDALGLACVTILAGGVMNLTPWGGPLARAAAALHLEPAAIFVPMLPAMVAGVLAVLAFAWLIGRRERARLGVLAWGAAAGSSAEARAAAAGGSAAAAVQASGTGATDDDAPGARRPRRLGFNALLTLLLMAALVAGVLPLPVLFMVGFSIALVVNYPSLADQRARIAAHAPNALAVVSVIFAAGIFTGILNGSGMVEAMSRSFLAIVPPALGPYLAPITAVASLPFTFFISNDAFYFGVLPIVSEAAQAYGIAPLEIARASLVGQPVHLLSPLVPSTYLLVGLAGVEFGDHQRFTLKWALGVCFVMLVVGLASGAFPLARG